MTNLVTTTPTRFSVIRPELLPQMQLLQSINSDTIISARMAALKALWSQYDPPNAAQYDLENTEFEPLKVQAENSSNFEMLVRDRVNQGVRGVTLAFAIGSDLDAIGSRYPYGVPRLDTNGDGVADETDAAYRMRLWNSPSILSLSGPGQGTYESYVFWALSTPMPVGQKNIRHAAALTTRGTGVVTIPLMQENSIVKMVLDPFSKDYITTDIGDPRPTPEQITAVYRYISDPVAARKGLTDVLNVIPCKVIHTTIDADIYLFPGVNSALTMKLVADAVNAFVEGVRWLGGDLTIMGLEGAMAQTGVYDVFFRSPTENTKVDQTTTIKVDSVRLHFAGTGE